jgi:hypothetical protein
VWERGEVLTTDAGNRCETNIRNISKSGLLFDTPHPYTVGEDLWLRIRLEGEAYAVQGVVRQSMKLLNNHMLFETGVEFVKPDPRLVEHVADWESQQTTSAAA